MRIHRNVRLGTIALSAGLALSLAACGGDDPTPAADGLQTLTIGLTSAMDASWAPLAAGQAQGFFEAEGIAIETINPGAGGVVLQLMASDQIDIGAVTPDSVIAANFHGQRVQMIYNWLRGDTRWLAVNADSDINSYRDLVGKKVGVSTMGGGAMRATEAGMELEGISRTDAEFIVVGTGAAAYDALSRGRVDALSLWDTEYAGMENLGAKLKFVKNQELGRLFGTTFAAEPDWIEANKDLVEGFGRAFSKSVVWATENPEGAIESMWEIYPETKTSDGADFLAGQANVFKARNSLALIGDPAANKNWGAYTPEDVQVWIDFAVESAIIEEPIDAEGIYTNEFVEAYSDFDVAEVTATAGG